MHILLCLGNPRKKCNTLYGYVPSECPNQTSLPLFQAPLTFSALMPSLSYPEQPSPLMLPHSGSLPRHGPIFGHHSPPQTLSPPSLSPNHWLTPLLISHTAQLTSDLFPWHRPKVQLPHAVPRISSCFFGHSLQVPGSSSTERMAYAPVSSAVTAPILPSQPPRPVTHLLAPWLTGWLQGSLKTGSAAHLIQYRQKSIKKCNIQSP